MFHGCLALGEWHAGSTFGIRHQESPCLINAVAPLCDVVTVQSATGLVGAVLFYQFTLAAHGLLTIKPRMVKVGEIQTDTDSGTRQTSGRSLQQMLILLLAQAVYAEGNDHSQNNEQVVVGHLHMVGQHLQGGKECRHQHAPQVFATIGQHHTGYHRRQIGQRHDFPDVAGGYDDKEIAAECPYHGTQGR